MPEAGELRCALCKAGSITPHVHVIGTTADGRPTLTSVRREQPDARPPAAMEDQ